MKERISRREWEQLSAYMDNQLGVRERTGIEARLQTDVSLRQAWDDLVLTRAAVKALPHLRAPRNFTLTPAMAGKAGRRQRQTPRLFNTFRLASAVSSLLLVMVVLVDLFGLGRVAMMPAQEMAAPSAKILEAEEMAVPEEEAQPMLEARAEDATVEKEAAGEEDSLDADEIFINIPTSPPEEGLAYEPAADSEIPRVSATPARLDAIKLVEIALGAIAIISGFAAFSFRHRKRL